MNPVILETELFFELHENRTEWRPSDALKIFKQK
mgnify:CR=1 FL=1|jgi:hypothetical protein